MKAAVLPPAALSSAASARVSTMMTGMLAWLALTITGDDLARKPLGATMRDAHFALDEILDDLHLPLDVTLALGGLDDQIGR